MYNIIIKPAHKQINPKRLAGGTYHNPETAKLQHTVAKSAVNKPYSRLYLSLVSHNKDLTQLVPYFPLNLAKSN